ncbi:DUF6551 family protein [uncultured Devosia sp.]|uniref:DUF6551 family protein n=1 Tax=uncultured Devosia sp. TaxID=211434 RepID=UPI00261A79DC|nr:DUF6551 family protein [uncultured Devosia sp.]
MSLLPLASFSFEPPPTPARDLGAKGKEAWLPLVQLRIDESYQRPVDAAGRKTIRGIIENFSWTKFAPLVVSPRPGGLYAVVDGQHRAVACALHGGIKEVPCHILSCTPAEEAAAFATINGIVTRMHPQYLFRARIAAGDKSAVAGNEAAMAAGVKILAYPVASSLLKVGETLAGKTIELELQRVGRTALVAALELITRTGSGNAGLVKASMIEGFCDVYATHPKWLATEDECRRVVHRKTVRAILTAAMQRQGNGEGTLRAMVAQVLAHTLHESLGDGGKTINPLEVERAEALKAARKGRAPVAFQKRQAPKAPSKVERDRAAALARTQEAHRLVMEREARPVTPPKPKVDERALIEAHLKKHGVRRFESGATGNTSDLLDWLNRNGHSARRGKSRLRKPYVIDGKMYDLSGLFNFVNKVRQKFKLEPLTNAPAVFKGNKPSGSFT